MKGRAKQEKQATPSAASDKHKAHSDTVHDSARLLPWFRLRDVTFEGFDCNKPSQGKERECMLSMGGGCRQVGDSPEGRNERCHSPASAVFARP